jgi:hypothetical protein
MKQLPFRFIIFLAGLMVYALFGSPTPDSVSWAELIVGLCLLLAVSPRHVFKLIAFQMDRSAALFIIFGMTIPCLVGIVSGQDTNLLCRDLIAFAFLTLPFLMWSDKRGHKKELFYVKNIEHKQIKLLYFAAFSIGVVFTFRLILSIILDPLKGFVDFSDNLYMGISPLVVLSCLLGLAGVGALLSYASIRKYILAGALLVAACSVLAVLYLTMQRATLIYCAVFVGVCLFYALLRRADRALPAVILTGVLTCSFVSVLTVVLSDISVKTDRVGLNMRWEELSAVIEVVTQSPRFLLLGTGWGGTFISPAAGGIEVNFTHSLLSSMLLKTGLIGLSLTMIYIWLFVQRLYALRFYNFYVFMILAGPFLIPLLFYGSYKSLDYGLVLLLIYVSARPDLHIAPWCSIQKELPEDKNA